MSEDTALTIYTTSPTILPDVAPSEPEMTSDLVLSLEQVIARWLTASYQQSQSEKTRTAYTDTLADFRAYLRARGHDLDSDRKIVADLAEIWAAQRKPQEQARTGKGEQVAVGTWKQRLSILSSFYRFAQKEEVLLFNPIERIARKRKTGHKDAAHFMEPEQVQDGLATLDRTTPEGQRDYALLSVALATGHRSSELAGLCMKHLHFHSNTCLVEWERCKGNEVMKSVLKVRATRALLAYLHTVYGADLTSVPPEAPVWISFSKRNPGQAIGTRTISNICQAAFGTTKVHTTRHTAAVHMMKRGATLAEVGHFLGHKNLKTTSDYLEEQVGYENPYGDDLEATFGI
ncbi:MAG: tyrosine-type recombinase/integrase [Ktedonobacteraceae bacterium]